MQGSERGHASALYRLFEQKNGFRRPDRGNLPLSRYTWDQVLRRSQHMVAQKKIARPAK
jgi:hypothetical protein